MSKWISLISIFVLLTLQSCFLYGEKKLLSLDTKIKQKADLASSLTSVNVSNNQVTILGTGFANVTSVQLKGTSLDTSLSINSITDSQIIASATSAISLLVGETFNLIIGTADAQVTYAITFTLQDGAVTASKIASMGATSGQVLKYNGTNWAPANLSSSQTYLGTWNANTNNPDISYLGTFNNGDYYIVTIAGTYSAITYNVGDWAMFNGTAWEKIDNSSNVVSSFNTRRGAVTLQPSDYVSLKDGTTGKVTGSKIADIADVDFTTPPANGQVLKWNSASSTWLPANDSSGSAGIALTDLSASSPLSYNSTTGAFSLPTANVLALPLTGLTSGSGALSATDTILQGFGKLMSVPSDYVSKSSGASITTGTIAVSGTGMITVPTATGVTATEVANVTYVNNTVNTAIANNGVWNKGASNSINYTAGNVGIGTSSPQKKLHINNSGLLIDGGSVVDGASYTTRFIVDTGSSTGHVLADLKNNNGSVLYVGGSNVGVGTAGLSVASSARYWRIKSATPGSNGSYISISELRFVWGGTPQSLTGYSVTNLGGTFDYALANIKDGVVETTNANNIAATTSSLDIYFDLGTAQTVTEIQIAPQGTQDSIVYNTPTNLIVESSNDASVWVQVGSHASISIDYPNWNAGSYRSFAVPGPAATLLSRLTVEGVNSTAANAALQVINSSQDSILYARNDGRVGIGTTSPSTLLEILGSGANVYKQSVLSNSSSQKLWTGTVADTIGTYIGGNAYYSSSYQFIPNYTAASGINFRQDGSTEFWNDTGLTSGTSYVPTKRLTITNTGNVGIGTTSPNDKLEVNGEVRVASCVKNVGGTAIAGTCSSDERFKKEIIPMGKVLDQVSALEPVRYHWRTDEFPNKHWGEQEEIGLIAQQVKKVFPELVEKDSEGYYRVRYHKLPMLMIGAVKELNERFNSFYDDFKALLARVMNLEVKNKATDRLVATVKSETDSKIAKLETENAVLKKKLENENLALKIKFENENLALKKKFETENEVLKKRLEKIEKLLEKTK